jgi:DNA-directed RNA polymerase specialized sigma24 family protein
MSSEGSVTHWLDLLRTGDRAAAQPLWERYFRLLVHRARSALRGAPQHIADEEDVALSAFDTFCRGVEQGRFPNLEDRDGLWRLLVVLTARKAYRVIEGQQCQKRGGGKVRAETDLPAGDEDEPLLARVIGQEPTPEFAVQVAEECQRLLAKLPDADLRTIAVLRMEGHTVEEIAAQLGRSPRTVGLKLQLIRALWREEGHG